MIGGGPAGSMFSYFFLEMAERIGQNFQLDIYEPKDFTTPGPAGCNMCGGIISESLVQALATEGINLPPTMIQRGIDSYMLHMDIGTVKIETPLKEKRIGAVHRGGGPRNVSELKWCSFDSFIQSLALEKGANLIHKRVKDIEYQNGKPVVYLSEDESVSYDLVVVAVGVSSHILKNCDKILPDYQSPLAVKTFIREFQSDESRLSGLLGNSMHVFLLDIPELEFAAAIPKGDYASVCVLCNKDGLNTLDKFMSTPEVTRCLNSELTQNEACKCSPKMNLETRGLPYTDRLVFIGDSGVTRLYKDGIGAAYRTAKAAATTAIFKGVSKEDFNDSFWSVCKKIKTDNKYGKFIFFVSGLFKKFRFTRKVMFNVVKKEQSDINSPRPLSTVLWDMFTGSAPYKEIFYRTMTPSFLWSMFISLMTTAIGPTSTKSKGSTQ